MRNYFDGTCTGHLVLTENEYKALPVVAQKKVKGYAKDYDAGNHEHVFAFYGKTSMELAIEVCRYHHLTLEPYRFQEVAP